MGDFDAILTRLRTTVPDLRLVEDATAFAALVQSGRLPMQSPAAHVIPGGMQGGRVEAMTGLFIQDTVEIVTVILSVTVAGQTGTGRVPDLHALLQRVIAALVGWAPEVDGPAFELRRVAAPAMNAGAVVYQIDFSIQDQLRIPT